MNLALIFVAFKIINKPFLQGNKQVHQAFGDEHEIVMENHNKYTKELQTTYPRDSEEWCKDNSVRWDHAQPDMSTVHKTVRGRQRWTGLPKPVEVNDSFFLISTPLILCLVHLCHRYNM